MKNALCVGINDYGSPDSDLKGCVNDAAAWATLLTNRYDFASSDVTVLLDGDATKAAILSGLASALAGARSGDVVVFTNSSHGTYIADRDPASEELDRYDEAICPVDYRDNLIVDDELRELFSNTRRGVRLSVISDSCHSGSVTRAPAGIGPDERRARFLSPREVKLPVIVDMFRARPKDSSIPESAMKDLLVSGCRANEYSYDARFGDTYHGAMTYFALAAIRAARYRISYSRLARLLGDALAENDYDQHPQLEGRVSYKRRQIFT